MESDTDELLKRLDETAKGVSFIKALKEAIENKKLSLGMLENIIDIDQVHDGIEKLGIPIEYNALLPSWAREGIKASYGDDADLMKGLAAAELLRVVYREQLLNAFGECMTGLGNDPIHEQAPETKGTESTSSADGGSTEA